MQITLRTRTSAKILARISPDKEQEWKSYVRQNSNDENKLKGVLLIGELGMTKDFTKDDTFEAIQKLFEVKEDQIRQAAAISLGGITLSNPQFYLAKLFGLIQKSGDKDKYMYLCTLKEIIQNKPASLVQNMGELMGLYLEQSKSQNGFIKSTVAESIGFLFKAEPKALSGTGIFD